MKAGRTMQELAVEIKRQAQNKRDFIAPAPSIRFDVKDGKTAVALEGIKDAFMPGDTFHDQVSGYTHIPAVYYRRMLAETPKLLATNVNHWLGQGLKDKRMIRTLDGKARAFLSDRYRPLDNVDLAEAVMPIIGDRKLEAVSTEITERRLYLKLIDPALNGTIQSRIKDDRIRGGLAISNSEIGFGTLGVSLFIERVVCVNGLVVEDAIRKFHVGRRTEVDAPMEMLRDATRLADDKAFWMKVQDVVHALLSVDRFNVVVERINQAANQETGVKNPVAAVEELKNRFSLTETEQGAVLRHLVDGGDLSQWGVVNAVTRAASDAEDYDRYDEMERFGGKVLELPKKDWAAIAKAN